MAARTAIQVHNRLVAGIARDMIEIAALGLFLLGVCVWWPL